MKRELDVLRTLGMIVSLPKDSGEIRQYYAINRDHPGWMPIDAALATAKLIAAEDAEVDLLQSTPSRQSDTGSDT